MTERGFETPRLDESDLRSLDEHTPLLRAAILTMTAAAESGHPGGSLSSLEILRILHTYANLRPGEPHWPSRDRIVVSHGHVSPGVYAALAEAGFFDLEDVVAHFRQAGSPFEGHVEHRVPGVEWSSGNLGQGLSAGVGCALAARLTGGGWHTYVAMSDGEQMKGQVGEARRLAMRHGLTDLTVVVDANRVQISGHTDEVMHVDIAAGFASDGWAVVEVDGHDLGALYEAIAAARADRTRPYCVLAHTVIGHGISFMEDLPEFHGRALTRDEYERAMGELGLDPCWLDDAVDERSEPVRTMELTRAPLVVASASGEPRTYARDKTTDCRSAWGAALVDMAEANPDLPIAVFDCDLAASVKTGSFAAARPAGFIQCGVGEHNAAVASGAASVNGVLSFWADFGVFGLDEAYNQQRLNDINEAGLKLALTHCGLDVGEDGRTHQCVDYVGSLRNLFGWRLIVPADPNQTDRAVRHAATSPGCVALAMGRSKLPAILDASGEPAFGGGYEFRYGEIVPVRVGGDAVVLAMGTPAGAAVEAADALRAEGLDVGVGIVACPLELDDAYLAEAVARARVLVTVEDHSVRSGLAVSVAGWAAERGIAVRLVRIGVEGYQSSGASKDLYARVGLDAAGIAERVRTALAES